MKKDEKIKLICELSIKIFEQKFKEAKDGAFVGEIWLDSISDAENLLKEVTRRVD